MKPVSILVAVIIAALGAGAAQAAALRVFVGGAMTVPVREVAAAFTTRTGAAVEVVSDTTGSLQKRLQAGETADLVLVTRPAIDALQKAGLLAPAPPVDLARGLIGIAVRKGAPLPDISTVEGLKAALVKARAVSYVDPAAGGTSGRYFEGLLTTLGIAAKVKPKVVYRNQGSEVAQAVASGAAELGITFTSELAPNPGVTVVGPLPPAVQSPAIYSAALTSAAAANPQARALLADLAGPAGAAAIRRLGLEVLTGR